MARVLVLLIFSFSLISCTSSDKKEDSEKASEPRSETMIASSSPKAKKKRRASPKSCTELYQLLYEMSDFHAVSRQICISRGVDRCTTSDGEDIFCVASKATLCQQKFLSQQLNYMKRFRKRKCWTELMSKEKPA